MSPNDVLDKLPGAWKNALIYMLFGLVTGGGLATGFLGNLVSDDELQAIEKEWGLKLAAVMTLHGQQASIIEKNSELFSDVSRDQASQLVMLDKQITRLETILEERTGPTNKRQ